MSYCWASSLGECSQKYSREHLVSKAVFDATSINVQGFDWCKEPRRIGIESLTAKILCTSHNNDLSEIDIAASNVFKAIKECNRLTNIRKHVNARYKVEVFHVDAKRLERWFLKTLINLSNNSNYLIGLTGEEPGLPSPNLVRICYGLDSFEGKAGLYVVAAKGQFVDSNDSVNFAPLVNETHILGGLFMFHGFKFFLSLIPQDLSLSMNLIPNLEDEWRNANYLWRFGKFNFKNGKHLSHAIKFQW